MEVLRVGEVRAPRRRVLTVGANDGLLVFVVASFAVAGTFFVRGVLPDLWLAVAAGKTIMESGLPTVDRLTVWGHGGRWIDQQWLAQVLIYKAYAAGGLRAAVALCDGLGLAAAAFVFALARRSGATQRSVAAIAALGGFPFVVSASVPRTQSLVYPLFVALLCLLSSDSRRPSRRILLSLPLLMLWANLHGSVAMAALLVSMHALLTSRGRRYLAVSVAVAAVLCPLASPYATALPAYYKSLLLTSSFGAYVTEWQPTHLALVSVGFFALLALALYLTGRCRNALTRSEVAILCLTGLAGLLALRNMVWFVIAAMLLLPPLLDRVIAFRPPLRAANIAVATAGVILALSTVLIGGRDLGRAVYPEDAAARAASAAGSNGRVFADEFYADWLLLEQPQLAGRVAYDTRFELLPPASLKVLAIARITDGAGWRRLTHGYHVFLLSRRFDDALVSKLLGRPSARVVYRNAEAIVITA